MRSPNRPMTHPGALIREDVLPHIDMTKTEFAKALGISRQMLHGILSEKYPVTAEMAVRLGHVIGNGPDIWLNMQKAYDLWHAQRSVDTSKLKRISAAEAA